MRLLVIDNYDSFTFNLVQYLGELGATSEVIRNDVIEVDAIAGYRPDAIVISPGPCTPKEAGISVEAVRHYAGRVPLLGVCLGHQSIGAAYGAEIVPARTLMHGKTSEIRHTGEGLFSGLPNPLVATRYHSLAIDRATLPAELEVTAWTDDGEVMGIVHTDLPVAGVQFHPESISTPEGKQLLQNFLDMSDRKS